MRVMTMSWAAMPARGWVALVLGLLGSTTTGCEPGAETARAEATVTVPPLAVTATPLLSGASETTRLVAFVEPNRRVNITTVSMARVAEVYVATGERVEAGARLLGLDQRDISLRAPFAGVVVQRQVEVGDLAAPGAPLLVLEDDSELRVVASIAAADAARVSAGTSYAIELATGEHVQGVLEAVVPTGGAHRPGHAAILVVPNDGGMLRTGVVASVVIPAAPRTESAFEVDERAVVNRGGLKGVFVVRDNEAELIWCSVDGRVRDGRVRILDGLRLHDVVVADATIPGLADGRLVSVSR